MESRKLIEYMRANLGNRLDWRSIPDVRRLLSLGYLTGYTRFAEQLSESDIRYASDLSLSSYFWYISTGGEAAIAEFDAAIADIERAVRAEERAVRAEECADRSEERAIRAEKRADISLIVSILSLLLSFVVAILK